MPRTWPSADSSLHQSPRGADADVPGGKTGPLFARYPATGHLPRDHFAYLIHRSSGHQIVAATATLLQQVADSTVTVLYRVASQPMSLTSKQAPPFFLASAFFFRVPFFRPLRRVRSAQCRAAVKQSVEPSQYSGSVDSGQSQSLERKRVSPPPSSSSKKRQHRCTGLAPIFAHQSPSCCLAVEFLGARDGASFSRWSPYRAAPWLRRPPHANHPSSPLPPPSLPARISSTRPTFATRLVAGSSSMTQSHLRHPLLSFETDTSASTPTSGSP